MKADLQAVLAGADRLRQYYAHELSIVTCKKRQRMAARMGEDDDDVQL